MGRPKKNKKEELKGAVAKGFIDMETHNDIAELAQRRGEIIVNLQRKVDALEADMKGTQDKLKFCQNNDQRIVESVVETLCKLESGLLHGLKDLGEITAEDVSYNMNLVKRIVVKKHGRK